VPWTSGAFGIDGVTIPVRSVRGRRRGAYRGAVRTTLLAPLLLVPVLLVGCAQAVPDRAAAPTRSASASATAGATAVPTAAAPAPTAVVDETPDAAAGAGRGPARTASTGSGGLPSTAVCSGPSLDIALASTDSGAGSIDYRIAFTNRGRTACHVSGAPRASLIDPTGDPVGRDADGTGAEGPFVRVPPGGSASTDVRVVNVGTDGGPLAGRCTTVPVVAIAIDAPNYDRYEQVPVRIRGCIETDVSMLSVSVLRGGS